MFASLVVTQDGLSSTSSARAAPLLDSAPSPGSTDVLGTISFGLRRDEREKRRKQSERSSSLYTRIDSKVNDHQRQFQLARARHFQQKRKEPMSGRIDVTLGFVITLMCLPSIGTRGWDLQ